MLCTCITNFDTFRRHLRPNNNVKCRNSRFYGEREHMTVNFHSLCYLRSHLFCCWIVRPHCRSWTHWNKRKVVQVTRTWFSSDVFVGAAVVVAWSPHCRGWREEERGPWERGWTKAARLQMRCHGHAHCAIRPSENTENSLRENMGENFRMNTVELLNQVSFDSGICLTTPSRTLSFLIDSYNWRNNTKVKRFFVAATVLVY